MLVYSVSHNVIKATLKIMFSKFSQWESNLRHHRVMITHLKLSICVQLVCCRLQYCPIFRQIYAWHCIAFYCVALFSIVLYC